MTFEQNSALPRRFVTSTLPWLLGLGAFVLYLATMTRWVTYASAPTVMHAAGLSWDQDLIRPLQYLVFSPFRLLPTHLIPPALNIFNALLASLVIVVVARAIALLKEGVAGVPNQYPGKPADVEVLEFSDETRTRLQIRE